MKSRVLTFHIRTYGCQMNARDSEALAALLERCGYRPAPSEQEADILLFNTCSVRDQAERKAIGKVGLMKRLKRERPGRIIGVLGCMAQRRGAELLDRLPHLDFVLGTRQLHRLPEMLEAVRAGQRGLAWTAETAVDFEALAPHARRPGPSAAVAVMRGCNQYCTYCIVPYVRGPEQSRPADAVVAEVAALAEAGVREVLLLGQNITAYGVAEARRAGTYSPEASPFAELLHAVARVPGIQRIRFTSPHPKYMNAAFIAAVTEIPQVCEALHLPLQSGSNRILQRMRRGYTIEDYLAVVRAIRTRRPDFTFSTDIIVGFPGETEEDFEATRRVMETVDFDMAYVFKYSPRPGTRAAEFADDVPAPEKLRRNQVLLELLETRVARRNRAAVGRNLEVLVEGPSKRNPRRWSGRARNNKVCLFPPVPGIAPGDLATFRVERATAHSLFGRLIQGKATSRGRQPD